MQKGKNGENLTVIRPDISKLYETYNLISPSVVSGNKNNQLTALQGKSQIYKSHIKTVSQTDSTHPHKTRAIDGGECLDLNARMSVLIVAVRMLHFGESSNRRMKFNKRSPI